MSISGREVAIILSDHFDADEFNGLHKCLSQAGALVSVVGEESGKRLADWTRMQEATVEVTYEEARSYSFDVVVISNGYSPDEIRVNNAATGFILDMYNANRIVGAIYHGPQVLISLGILKDKNVTGSPSIKIDLENAGATYLDEPVVVDGNLITGREPSDLQDFCGAIIDELRRLQEYIA